MNGVDVDCACGARFQVPASLKGGLANCTGCGKATAVRRGFEAAFWLFLALGIGLVLIVSVMFGVACSPTAGGVAFGIGAAILTVAVIAS